MKFCKSCGDQVNSLNYCKSCGKQYFSFRNKWIITSFVLLLLFLASSVFSFLLYQQTVTLRSDLATGADNQASLSSEISTLTADLQALQKSHDKALEQISSLESEYSVLSYRKDQLQSSYDQLSEQLDDCESSYFDLRDRAELFRNYVVFYNPGGKYYHSCVSHTCGVRKNSNFSNYQDWLASQQGYESFKQSSSILCTPSEAKSRGYLPCPYCMG